MRYELVFIYFSHFTHTFVLTADCGIALYTHTFAETPEHLRLQICTQVNVSNGCPKSRIGQACHINS